MVLHVVIYKGKPGTTNEEIETTKEAVENPHSACYASISVMQFA